MLPCSEFIEYIKWRFYNAHPGNVAAFLTAVCKVDSVEFCESPAENEEFMFISIGDRQWVRTVPKGCPDAVVVHCTQLIGEALMYEENWGF